jgi:hypothetical protein
MSELDAACERTPASCRVNDAALSARVTILDAWLVIAREYGFPTGRGLVEGLREESAGWRRARSEPRFATRSGLT